MSSGGPWSVKGIDPRARARAKTAARREGMTLGEWLNRVILDDNELAGAHWDDALEAYPGFDGAPSANDADDRLIRAMINRLSERIENAEQASARTLSELDKAISQLASNVVKSGQKQSEKLTASDRQLTDVQRSQVELAKRLKSLEGQVSSAAPGQGKAIEQTLMKLARRVYEYENDMAARLYEQEETGRDAYRQSEARIDTLEARTEKLADLADRLESSERGTNDSARQLETAFARLDERLRAVENRNASDNVDLERRFERLTDDVAKTIAETRNQLGHTAGRVEDSERRQIDSMARLGDEISRLAQAIDTRFSENERRAEEARKDRRTEDALNTRIDAVRQENRDSMRRMAEEVTKLGRTLAERIERSEKRASHAVAAATDRMTEAVERIEKAGSNGEAELEDRLRQSEERTASKIDEAVGGVQERLAALRSETEETLTPVQRAMTALADRLERIEGKAQTPETTPEATPEPGQTAPASAPSAAPAGPSYQTPDLSQPLGPPPQAEIPASHFDSGKTDPFLNAPDPVAPEPMSEPASAPVSQPLAAPVLREPAQPAINPQATPLPTKRQARRARREQAAAHQAAPAEARAPLPPRPTARAGATADADFLASARERTRSTQDYGSYGAENRPSKFSRATLIAIPMAALIMLGCAGAILLWEAIQGPDETTIIAGNENSAFLAQIEAGLAEEDATTSNAPATEATPPSEEASPIEAEPVTQAPANMVADASGSVTPAPVEADDLPAAAPSLAATGASEGRPTLQSAAADGNPIARYQLGLQQLEAGDARSAAILLRRAAEQGVPDAQYRYAKLLETGEGVDIDLEEARRWTERAANAGHRRAMHNLAVMYYYGTGAERNFESAARWFQEAALLGLQDSQFNLALLFESGQGVPLSLPDAYAWYMISASANDTTSQERAVDLEEMMEADALTQARQAATSFQPRPIDPEVNGLYQGQPWDRTATANPADVERVQGFLSALGYGPGPIDGAMGTRTREAIMAFEADQGLPRTGRVDAVLIERLERAVNG